MKMKHCMPVVNFLLRLAKGMVIAILFLPVICLICYGVAIHRVDFGELRVLFRSSYWNALLNNRVEQLMVGRYVYEPVITDEMIRHAHADLGIYQNLPPLCFPNGAGLIICRYAEDAMMLKMKHNGQFYPLRWK